MDDIGTNVLRGGLGQPLRAGLLPPFAAAVLEGSDTRCPVL